MDCGFDAFTSGATINSITVRVEKYRSSGSGTFTDARLRMVIAGTIDTQDLASGDAWATTPTVATYVFSTGLPTAAQVLAADFGFVIAATAAGGPGQAAIDYGSIEVDYTAAATKSLPVFHRTKRFTRI